jgi:hypothetical protein
VREWSTLSSSMKMWNYAPTAHRIRSWCQFPFALRVVRVRATILKSKGPGQALMFERGVRS